MFTQIIVYTEVRVASLSLISFCHMSVCQGPPYILYLTYILSFIFTRRHSSYIASYSFSISLLACLEFQLWRWSKRRCSNVVEVSTIVPCSGFLSTDGFSLKQEKKFKMFLLIPLNVQYHEETKSKYIILRKL